MFLRGKIDRLRCVAESTAHLGIRADLEPSVAKMTLASEGKNGSGEVHPNFSFLGIVTHTHTNVVVAAQAAGDDCE